MGRYTGAVCKLCRREGEKLFLKGDRCHTQKCAIVKREYAPGHHGKRRPKLSDYGTQLREKQKLKRMYGVMEKQFRIFFKRAAKQRGITGDNLLQMLERRLDNVVYRLGFCTSRAFARQMVRHGHFLVNGKKIDIPSFLIKEGDVVEVKSTGKSRSAIAASLESAKSREIPEWLSLEAENYKGTVLKIPTRDEIPSPVNEALIVELYSK